MDTPATSTTPPSNHVVLPPTWDMVTDIWRWYNTNLRPLLKLTVIIALPTIALSIINLFARVPTISILDLNPFAWASIGLTALSIGVINTLWSMVGSIALYTYIQHPDVSATPWGRFTSAAQHLRRYAGTSILYGLIVLGGCLLFLIPGIWWAVSFSLAPLIALIERIPARAALKKSRILIKGNWNDVFIRGLVLALTMAALTIVINIGLGIVSGALSIVSDTLGDATVVVEDFVSVALTPLTALLSFRLYTLLKVKHA